MLDRRVLGMFTNPGFPKAPFDLHTFSVSQADHPRASDGHFEGERGIAKPLPALLSLLHR